MGVAFLSEKKADCLPACLFIVSRHLHKSYRMESWLTNTDAHVISVSLVQLNMAGHHICTFPPPHQRTFQPNSHDIFRSAILWKSRGHRFLAPRWYISALVLDRAEGSAFPLLVDAHRLSPTRALARPVTPYKQALSKTAIFRVDTVTPRART